MGFNCLKTTATSRRQFTFYRSVPRNSWYSFYQPRKDERLSRPWSHPVVLNTGLLDWETSALTTRPLLRKGLQFSHLNEHKFRHGFNDTVNTMYPCGNEEETNGHFLLHCHCFSSQRFELHYL